MEFYEKLQELRKQKSLTQEELANALFVSRTAISKWESGRGYPNIDSLKLIANYFNITIDELLSSEELLAVAQEDGKEKEINFRDLVFGLLDCGVAILFFLPFFAQTIGTTIQEVSLLSLKVISPYLLVFYYIIVTVSILFGLLTLTLQNFKNYLWLIFKKYISIIISLCGTLLFIISSQPYAAVLMFLFLTIKVLILVKLQRHK